MLFTSLGLFFITSAMVTLIKGSFLNLLVLSLVVT
ncbi:MAG: hypothetical protein HQ594_03505 [Candidatus Omnitrophica bacterium]|nr:hypothetical protein [Candidatus Omnitrophota bacterium]